MYSIIALVVFALTVHTHTPTQLFYQSGTMGTQGQLTVNLTRIQQWIPLQVVANGEAKDADLDCYLLGYQPQLKGWVILHRDESKENSCSFTYVPSNANSLRLWVVNQSFVSTQYDITVKQ